MNKQRRRRSEQGSTLIEMVVSACLLMMTSLSLVYTYSSTGLVNHASQRDVAIQESMENLAETLVDVPYSDLLSWNGISVDRGDHRVTIAANQIEVGLIVVEYVATDDHTGTVLHRVATYRSELGS
jgi:hypothetical protein